MAPPELAEVALERSLGSTGVGSEAAASAGAVEVATVDLSAGDAAAARVAWGAASTLGFFNVAGHGLPAGVVERAFAASEAFFLAEGGPPARAAAAPFARDANSGYEYKEQVRPSTGLADQKESLQVTARQGAMDGRWPSELAPDLEPACRELLEHAHALACRLLGLLEPRACPHVEVGTLAASHTLWSPDGQCTLRLLHYPPVEGAPEEVPEGAWRAGAHTDWDCLTLLFQREGEAGLECAANPRRAAAAADAAGGAGWVPVDPVPGAVTVNVGDMLGRWSDGRVLSNLHRVRMPAGEDARRSRFSIAFFMQADRSALITSSESADAVTAGDYILGRIRSNYS